MTTDDARFEMIRVRIAMGLIESARIEFQSHLEQVRSERGQEMPHYETVAEHGHCKREVLYSGSDPVRAVQAGLSDTEHRRTHVTEEGEYIPGTLAS